MKADGYKSIALSYFKDVTECERWIGTNVFGNQSVNWLSRTTQSGRVETPMKLIKHAANVWPGSIFFGKSEVQIDTAATSRGYLNTVPASAFTNAIYVLLLGRMPDEAGREHYEAELRRGVSRDDLIEHIMDSDEYKVSTRKFVDCAESDLAHTSKLIQDDILFYRTRKEAGNFFDRTEVKVADLSTSAQSYLIHSIERENRTILFPGMNLIGTHDQDGTFRCGAEWIVYGPKVNLKAGLYEVLLDIETEAGFSYHFDVCCDLGHNLLFQAKLSGNLKAAFGFVVPRDIPDFEARILNIKHNCVNYKIRTLGLRKLS